MKVPTDHLKPVNRLLTMRDGELRVVKKNGRVESWEALMTQPRPVHREKVVYERDRPGLG